MKKKSRKLSVLVMTGLTLYATNGFSMPAIKEDYTCPIGKEKFSSFDYPPQCPTNKFVMFKNEFTKEEQLATKNSISLVGLLYKMCKVNLVKKTESDKNTNEVNNTDIEMTMDTAKEVIESMESGIQ